ncbi:hypothetical protein PAU_01955 [Photorhabdus asymbiotica]|uniref:Uncharacterized protein n=1 Tax=Photorhabdus asymbiotica subsp. asymbiotica (strain ATCC 43949 / 3105-77) TaxID=553480 RepID=C7BIA9_PHOAA|nr:hypothetical protein PAU_01955 [Photorhabdus asymbiotica]
MLLGIRSLAAALQLEIYWVYTNIYNFFLILLYTIIHMKHSVSKN